MTDREQIDELARDIEKRLEYAKNVVGSMNKGIGYWIAEDLVDKNYRKVTPNVDFVVKDGELSTIQMNARKATAKEILQLLNGHTLDNGGFTWTIDKEDLRFLAEEYGVEIEE